MVIAVILAILLSFMAFFVKQNIEITKQNKQNVSQINIMKNEIQILQTQLKNQNITLEKHNKEISEKTQVLVSNNKKIQDQQKEITELKKKLTTKLERDKEVRRYTVSRGMSIENNKYLGNFKISFYTPYDGSTTGRTAIGTRAIPGKTVAVDPDVIPLGTKVYIEGFGIFTAEDTGGAIKGNKLDVCVATRSIAYKYGIKHLKIWVIK